MSTGSNLALRTSDPRAPRIALWLSSAGLEATYIYAWAAFVLTLMSGQRYSAILALSTFAAASLAARAARPARLRMGELAVLHTAAVTLLSLLSLQSLSFPGYSIWRVDRVFASSSPKVWGTLALTVFFSVNLWLAGFRHGREPRSYQRVCARFDRGILWLGALFTLKLLWRGQRDANLNDGITGSLIAPYFLFAIVALAGARNRGMGAKSLIGGYAGLGRIVHVSLGGVLVSVACVLLFLPELQLAVRVGYDALRQLDGPVADVFAFVLYVLLTLWMLIRGPHQAAPALKKQVVFVDPKAQYHDHAIVPVPELPAWSAWAISIALLVSLLSVAGYIIWRVRKPAAVGGSSFFSALWLRVARLWLALCKRVARAARALRPAPQRPEPVRLYIALLQWGRHSGSSHRPSETPLEYACRLQRRMPALRAEIELIAAAYSAHVYGRRVTLECSDEKAALRRLRSLKLWPQRVRLWLTGDGDQVTVTHSLQDQTVSEAAS